MRLIDADALIQPLKLQIERYDRIGASERAEAYRNVLLEISEAPTIDAAPVKHGRWIDVNRSDGLRECSACHDWQIHYEKYIPNYCPNCGAKMDGDKNATD